MKTKLINTIELEPQSFSKDEYESPSGSSKELPQEWDAYWLKSLSDSNIKQLIPIESGSWLVDIETIKEEELKVILNHELEDVDLLDYKEQIGNICGGIAVKQNGKIIISPTCCGDLANLSEWEEIIDKEDNTWHQLWIGHPWVFYKKSNEFIGFSEYTDFDIGDFKDIAIKHKILKSSLYSEIKLMRESQLKFEKKISTVLKELKINNANEIAKLMLGN